MDETDTIKSDAAPLAQLVDILDHPEQRILPLLYKSTNPQDRQAKRKTQTELIEVLQYLFQSIEQTAKNYHELIQENKQEEAEGQEKEQTSNGPTLSGLSELYLPETVEQDAPLDVETLWGQVELQNLALNKLLKKSINRLARSPKDIMVLDMSQLSSDDEEDGNNSESDNCSRESRNLEAMDQAEDDDSGDEDEEAKRIRERMERAMNDAESDEDEGYDEEPEDSAIRSQPSEKKEDLYDPVVEDLNDGFFDLNEMEEYADEEEDYLPQETRGTAETEQKKKKERKNKSFHQMQRDGDLLNHYDDDEDEEIFEDLYEEQNVPVKRNKYRDDEDIEALYSLYQPPNDSDSEAEDAANMTAADLFGQPSQKHMKRYNAKKAKEEVKTDDDSWGEYDFEQDNPEDKYDCRNNDCEKQSNSDNDDEENGAQENKEDEPRSPKVMKHVDNSRHGKQQERLRQQTEELQNELLSEKPWQMTGETKSTSRPVNSLLEGTPEFEMASKQAPTITIEHTISIEEAIKKRILAEDWDDVVPRELPDVGWHKKRGELPEVSQEKSKLGLGELYEREYLKKAVGYDKDAEEKKTEEDKAKDEMKQLFANLCSKLDGLSNYHFAPRPIADEAEIRPASAPALAMEEVLPLHFNDGRGVAPEEVYAAKRGRDGVLRGETEMDQQERKRLRQSKKAARRKTRKEKLADEKLISRLAPGMGLNNPYEKRKMREELQMARSKGKIEKGEHDKDDKYGSSGTFFKRLQAEAKQSIKGQPSGQDDREKKSKPKSSALKL